MNIEQCIINFTNKYNFYETILTKESNLFLETGIDSLSFIELICDIENFFEIEIKIEEIGKCQKVDDLIKVVKSKLKET